MNTYGSGGYSLGGYYGPTNSSATDDLTALPSGVSLSLTQGERWCWQCPSNPPDARALQAPDGSDRRAAAWFHTQLRLRLSFNAAYAGNVRLYAVDFDGLGRRESVTVTDSVGPQSVNITTDFSQGAWMTFPVSVNAGGTVTINVNSSAGPNAVLAGIFLGDAGAPLVPPAPPSGPAPGGAAAPTVQSDLHSDPGFQSGIADAPDPFVLPVSTSFCSGLPAGSGCYYAYTTNVLFNPIPVWKSTNLTTWYQAGYFNDTVSVDPNAFARWSAEAFDKWAPGVIKIGSTYVMWYTAQNGHGPHCLGVAHGDVAERSLPRHREQPARLLRLARRRHRPEPVRRQQRRALPHVQDGGDREPAEPDLRGAAHQRWHEHR